MPIGLVWQEQLVVNVVLLGFACNSIPVIDVVLAWLILFCVATSMPVIDVIRDRWKSLFGFAGTSSPVVDVVLVKCIGNGGLLVFKELLVQSICLAMPAIGDAGVTFAKVFGDCGRS